MNQHLDGIIETCIRMNIYQVFHVIQNICNIRPLINKLLLSGHLLTSPGGQLVLFQLLHLQGWAFIVHLENTDEVCDCQHAHKS